MSRLFDEQLSAGKLSRNYRPQHALSNRIEELKAENEQLKQQLLEMEKRLELFYSLDESKN